MRYIAAIDYQHLDNGVFLTTLARSLSQQQDKEKVRPILLHGDSAYTERIMQTGVIREQARIRSVKDLNHRLVALFADQGVSTVGINPNQRNLITLKDNSLSLDHNFLDTLPERSVLLLSTLVHDLEADESVVMDLPRIFNFLADELEADQLFIFTKSDEAEVFTTSDELQTLEWSSLDESYREQQIPEELSHLSRTVRMTTARDFNQIPDLQNTILIKSAAD